MKILLEKLKEAWVFFSAIALVVSYFIVQGQRKKLEDAKNELSRKAIEAELKGLLEQAHGSRLAFTIAKERYDELKRTHPEFFESLPKPPSVVRPDSELSGEDNKGPGSSP